MNSFLSLMRTLLSFYQKKADLSTVATSGSYNDLKDIPPAVDISGKQDVISDLEIIRAGAAKGATALQEHQDISGKQDVISDLATIRSGAAKGATALQEHQDISGKQDVISDLETIRQGAAKGATALQEHQDISGKADKATTLAGYGITDAYTKSETGTAISTAIAGVVASAPEKFDTLKEIADWIDNDTTGAAKMANDIASLKADKQDAISDLATIRSNAATGAGLKSKVDSIEEGANNYTHPETHAASMIEGLAPVATSGSYSDLSNKPTIPTVTPVADILKAVYPVGAIYISTAETNPQTLFGFGTWERIGEGRGLIDCGSTYTAGKTGGSADAIVPYHTHTFSGTAAEHTHTFTGSAVNTGKESAGHTHSGTTGNQSANHTHSGTTNNCTAGGSHNHQPPSPRASGGNIGPSDWTTRCGYESASYTSSVNGTSAHGHAFTTGNESANHNHSFTTGGVSANHTHSVTASGSNGKTSITPSGSNSYAGTSGNTAGANMPPYLAVYMWKRTA